MFQAVTLDLRDTTVADDSDRPKGKARSVTDKSESRWRLFRDELNAWHPDDRTSGRPGSRVAFAALK